MSNDRMIVLTRGLPGSGKSTWARAWTARGSKRARVNRDDLRAMLFNEATHQYSQEEVVTAVQRAAVAALLEADWDAICDDTNLRPKWVREWFRFGKKHHADVGLKDFDPDVELAIKQDAEREKPVGEDVIRGMAARYIRKGQFLPITNGPVDPEPVDRYVPKMGTPPAIIVDVDGTVALMGDRSPYDYALVSEDKPNGPVIEAVRAAWHDGYEIIFMSGREDSCRDATLEWLGTHVSVPGDLHMRATGDQRKDAIVKRELFDTHVRDQYHVRYVLDDRDQVVNMWRDLGLTCLQVAPGAF